MISTATLSFKVTNITHLAETVGLRVFLLHAVFVEGLPHHMVGCVVHGQQQCLVRHIWLDGLTVDLQSSACITE